MKGIRTVIYPVTDIVQAKTLYSKLIASVKDADSNIIGLIQLP